MTLGKRVHYLKKIKKYIQKLISMIESSLSEEERTSEPLGWGLRCEEVVGLGLDDVGKTGPLLKKYIKTFKD